jgi:hypothetical protein
MADSNSDTNCDTGGYIPFNGDIKYRQVIQGRKKQARGA